MPLSCAELAAVLPLTAPMSATTRTAFLQAVSSALNGACLDGPGLAYRVAVGLLPRFFTPPQPSPDERYRLRQKR